MITGTVFNVQRFSTEDGPGIRTTVFLKGCPLRCRACCNPEGLSPDPQLTFRAARCIGIEACGRCLAACPQSAIHAGEDDKVAVDRDACTDCGQCVPACPSRALETAGQTMTVDEVLDLVEADAAFYRHSRGGLTLSGGEVLGQSRFAQALLAEARRRGLSTAIETSGMASWRALERLLPDLDVVHYDLKCLDSERHRRFTGVGNEIILRNFRRLCAAFPHDRIVARTALIPGFNDGDEDLRAIRDFLAGLSIAIRHETLPYHEFGESKYGYLGLAFPMRAPGGPLAPLAAARGPLAAEPH